MEPFTAALSGLLGVLVGALVAVSHERSKARRDFLSRQLSEFYSPMVGIREEIRILSDFRLKVSQQAGSVWKELCNSSRAYEDLESRQNILGSEREKLHTRIDYDNKQVTEKLIPAYQRMVDLFRDRYWLAEFETRQYFTSLIEFVESWNRFLSETHSREVLQRVDVKEETLLPFYENLKEIQDRLRSRVKNATE